ncbi:MAG: hypothetical protein LC794_13755 [Acidobacteria bacterium]|nr:hypothetical protein [Acidobacteriota bacterium]MCA1627738.1 hypothetical protein [Acidobacteriota bacterium]
MRIIFSLLLIGALLGGAFAQRPRTMEPEPAKTPAATPAPKTVKAKYEGGIFGYNKTMEGTLTFDDANNRLYFKDKKPPKEISIPYEAITSAFADTQKRQPRAATIASHIPSIYALPAHFIKKKVRYLTLQYADPDSRVNGITSFKLENKEMLESVLAALAQKTGMTLRGDVYVKKRDDSSKLTP